MKRLALMIAILVVASACSSSDVSSSTADSQQPTADTSEPTVDNAESAPTSRPDAVSSSTSIGDDGASLVPAPTIPEDAPPAPDFTMVLGDGESFTLSEQAMPVYMIFWADW